VTDTSTVPSNSRLNRAAGGTANYLDERTSIGAFTKFMARKIFPDHWSFMLGEIALYSFVVLLLSGVILTAFFVPSMDIVHYEGGLEQLKGQEMSKAFESTVHMSFEVPGGLLMRQIHHWAALIFTASIVTHMARIFFTGAFRKPRELNWLVGFTLMIMSLAAGFTGYSLPDDVLSGNGLRIIDGVIKSIPLIGTYISYGLFGGEFPGEVLIPRMFTAHILLIPGIILALVALHLFLVFLHKHTQYPGPGRTDKNVVGLPLFPVYTAKAGGFFFVVFGVIAALGAAFQINPVWNYGPYDPSPVSAGTQPDWYMLFIDGGLRIMPGMFEVVIGGYTLSLNVLIPAVVLPGLFFGFLAIYPWLEAWATGDRGEKHVLDRPRNAPVRTGLGVALITFYVVLVLEGSNDIVANLFRLSINDLTIMFRFAVFLLPIAAFWMTKRIAMGLQRKDRELVLHGHETGRIVRFESGEYIEVHEPLTDEERWVLVSYENLKPHEFGSETNDFGVRRKGARWRRFKSALSRFYFEDRIEPVTPAELAEAHEHHAAEIEAKKNAEPRDPSASHA